MNEIANGDPWKFFHAFFNRAITKILCSEKLHLGSSPPSLQRFWSRHFCSPPNPMQQPTTWPRKWYALLNEVRVLCSLLESERPGTANPMDFTTGPVDPKRGGFLLGFPKKGTKKGWQFLETCCWDMNLDCEFVVVFSWCCFVFWGGKWRMARPTAFFLGVVLEL